MRLTLDATIKMATFADEDDLPKSPRKAYDTRVIVASGGKYTFCYLPEEDLWKRLPDGLKDTNASATQMIKFRNQLFAFTRYMYQNTERYDPVFNVWSELNLHAGSAKLAVLEGEIYAVEFNRFNWTTITRGYNVKQCTWENLSYLVDSVEWMLVLLQPEAICMYLVGGIETIVRTTSQKLTDFTPWRISGRKARTC